MAGQCFCDFIDLLRQFPGGGENQGKNIVFTSDFEFSEEELEDREKES